MPKYRWIDGHGVFIIPVHEEMSKFTEMKVTLEMNSVGMYKLAHPVGHEVVSTVSKSSVVQL